MLLVWTLAASVLGALAMTGPAGLLGSAVAEDDITTPKGDAGDAGTQAADDSESSSRTAALIASLTIFVLAVFVGFEIITKVPPTLHTPLMSGSNAISGITLVGALLVAGGVSVGASRVWGFLAVVLATVNVVGGFLVTHRMLAMFNKPRR